MIPVAPRLRPLLVLLILLALLIVLIFAPNPSYAQAPTNTPTPSLTPTPPATYTPYPQSVIVDIIGTPTNIPALSLTPKPWYTPTRMAPGGAFDPPDYVSGAPDEGDQAHGFEAISNTNVLKLGQYIATVVVAFYGWLKVNFSSVLFGLRMFGIIVFLIIILYREFRRWAPELANRVETWRAGEEEKEDILYRRAVRSTKKINSPAKKGRRK